MRGCAIALRHLSGRLGLLLVALVLLAYLALALAPFRWVPPRRSLNGASTDAGGLRFSAPGLAQTREAPAWLEHAAANGTLRLDLRLRAYAPGRDDPGRIFTVSRDYHFRNLSLDQRGPDLVLQLRRPGSTPNGKPVYRLRGILADTAWHEIEVTITPGHLRVVIDGRGALTETLPEQPLVDWDRHYRVALGNELHGHLPWHGEVARAVVEVGAARVDYASPGNLELPARFWAFGNKPTWLFEDYVYPDSVEDWVANFVGFIPLGFLLAAVGGKRGSWRRALLLCAVVSLVVEIAQGFFARHPSTIDWVVNTLGGGVGAMAAGWLTGRAGWRPVARPRARDELLALLRTASHGGTGLPMEGFDERAIRWVVDTGLGPLFARVTAHHPDAGSFPFRSLVQAADLTARVIAADQMEAMAEIIDACRDEAPPLVLLKGISIAEQYYPAPHLRPMRDIDFLVERDAVPRIESMLSKLGYLQPAQRPAEFYETHHHSAPFFHPDTGVWVDVHRALVPSTSALRADRVFSVEILRTQLRASTFRGRRVSRLSDELQIVHLACHWAHRLQVVGGMVAMVDMTYLLKNARGVQWPRILEWTADSVARRYLDLLLTYLARRGLVDLEPAVLHRLSSTQSSLDRLTRDLGHALIDRYVVDGRDFGRLMSERNLGRLWRTFVLRRPPSRHLGLPGNTGGGRTHEQTRAEAGVPGARRSNGG